MKYVQTEKGNVVVPYGAKVSIDAIRHACTYVPGESRDLKRVRMFNLATLVNKLNMLGFDIPIADKDGNMLEMDDICGQVQSLIVTPEKVCMLGKYDPSEIPARVEGLVEFYNGKFGANIPKKVREGNAIRDRTVPELCDDLFAVSDKVHRQLRVSSYPHIKEKLESSIQKLRADQEFVTRQLQKFGQNLDGLPKLDQAMQTQLQNLESRKSAGDSAKQALRKLVLAFNNLFDQHTGTPDALLKKFEGKNVPKEMQSILLALATVARSDAATSLGQAATSVSQQVTSSTHREALVKDLKKIPDAMFHFVKANMEAATSTFPAGMILADQTALQQFVSQDGTEFMKVVLQIVSGSVEDSQETTANFVNNVLNNLDATFAALETSTATPIGKYQYGGASSASTFDLTVDDVKKVHAFLKDNKDKLVEAYTAELEDKRLAEKLTLEYSQPHASGSGILGGAAEPMYKMLQTTFGGSSPSMQQLLAKQFVGSGDPLMDNLIGKTFGGGPTSMNELLGKTFGGAPTGMDALLAKTFGGAPTGMDALLAKTFGGGPTADNITGIRADAANHMAKWREDLAKQEATEEGSSSLIVAFVVGKKMRSLMLKPGHKSSGMYEEIMQYLASVVNKYIELIKGDGTVNIQDARQVFFDFYESGWADVVKTVIKSAFCHRLGRTQYVGTGFATFIENVSGKLRGLPGDATADVVARAVVNAILSAQSDGSQVWLPALSLDADTKTGIVGHYKQLESSAQPFLAQTFMSEMFRRIEQYIICYDYFISRMRLQREDEGLISIISTSAVREEMAKYNTHTILFTDTSDSTGTKFSISSAALDYYIESQEFATKNKEAIADKYASLKFDQYTAPSGTESDVRMRMFKYIEDICDAVTDVTASRFCHQSGLYVQG